MPSSNHHRTCAGGTAYCVRRLARIARIAGIATVATVATIGSVGACRSESARDAAPLDSSDVTPDVGVVTDGPDGQRAVPRDWTAIRASDTLRVIAAYNSTTYFIYRGEPMGYEYELLKQFAADHDLVVKVIVVQN